MAVTSHVYTQLVKSLVDKKADLDSDVLKVALLSSYNVGSTQDTAQYVADVITGAVAVEVANGNGYTTGGRTLTSVSFTSSGHVYSLNCADPVWEDSSIVATHALFYDATPGSALTNPVLCYWDLGGTTSSTNSTFLLAIDSSGLLTITGV